MKFKILVTGANGYIGSVLCQKLAQSGHHIFALDIKTPNFPVDREIELIVGSCTEASLLGRLIPQADIIIPLAALVGAPSCDRHPELAKQVNYEAIQTLNRLRSKDQLVIFPMTNNGYTPAPGESFADENTPFKTDSLYTLTKLQAEQELLNAGNAISLRLASAFGPSNSIRWDLLIHHYIQEALTKNHLSIFEPRFKRSFVHIEDICAAFEHSLQNAASMNRQIFNIALPEGNISKLELAEKIKLHVPGLSVEIDRASKDPDARDFYVRTDKIKKTGFQAARTIDQGIAEVLNRYIQNHSKADCRALPGLAMTTESKGAQ